VSADAGTASHLFSIAFGPARLHCSLASIPTPMKAHPIIIASSTALAIIATFVLTACSPRKNHLEHFQDLPGLLAAMQAFSRDLTNQGLPLPQSVSLSELISRGYISSNSVHAFEGMETKVWLTANLADMNSVLMSARLPDGHVSAALADGSVQQFSAQRFAAHLEKSGQQGGAANGSQPETNSGASAAGSRR
jgi:hypothetical protein